MQFLRFYRGLGIVELNPEMGDQFGRVYRAVLIHTQRIARMMPEFKMHKVPGSVSSAVRMVLLDDELSETALIEDIFEGMSVFDDV